MAWLERGESGEVTGERAAPLARPALTPTSPGERERSQGLPSPRPSPGGPKEGAQISGPLSPSAGRGLG
jgi:hypothetical protein